MKLIDYIYANAIKHISHKYSYIYYLVIKDDDIQQQNVTIGTLQNYRTKFCIMKKAKKIDCCCLCFYIDVLDLYIIYEFSTADYYKVLLKQFHKDNYFLQHLLFLNSPVNYEQLTHRLNYTHLTFNGMIYKSKMTLIDIHLLIWKKLMEIEKSKNAYRTLFNLL